MTTYPSSHIPPSWEVREKDFKRGRLIYNGGYGLINIKKSKAPKENYVYIGRPSKWGNPFVIGRHGTRSQIIKKYEEWLLDNKKLMSALGELRGKVLGCYCLPQECHGMMLLRIANSLCVECGYPLKSREKTICRPCQQMREDLRNDLCVCGLKLCPVCHE